MNDRLIWLIASWPGAVGIGGALLAVAVLSGLGKLGAWAYRVWTPDPLERND